VRDILLWLLRPFMRFWVASVEGELSSVPRPRDIPQVHAPGADSDRLLIVGSGPAVGWGVLSHDLSLPGALARAVSARTGRGAMVDVIPDPRMVASTAVRYLDDARLWRYDAVVLMVGINDAIGLTGRRAWRRSMRTLLQHAEDASSLSTSIFVVGIPPIRSLRVYDAIIGGIAERHGQVLNRVTLALVPEFQRSTFVPFSPVPVPVPNRYRSPEEYRIWADLLVDAVALPLNRQSQVDRTPSSASFVEHADKQESDRQRAVDELGIAGTPPEERFDRIVELARRTFHAQAAMFSVVDNDRQWHKSRSGIDLQEMPREGSACAITITEAGAFVIPNTLDDERFAAHPLVVGDAHVRFYAGFPVEAPTGERIGALCILDSEPREPGSVDEALLREFAMLLQAELWRGVNLPV
jgi:hypothetical protein